MLTELCTLKVTCETGVRELLLSMEEADESYTKSSEILLKEFDAVKELSFTTESKVKLFQKELSSEVSSISFT
ncbi:hypothetical protein PGB90_007645 [Kerria lacca]